MPTAVAPHSASRVLDIADTAAIQALLDDINALVTLTPTDIFSMHLRQSALTTYRKTYDQPVRFMYWLVENKLQLLAAVYTKYQGVIERLMASCSWVLITSGGATVPSAKTGSDILTGQDRIQAKLDAASVLG